MPPPLAGRVALVTGAAGGVGGAWCRMLLEDGCPKLALVDIDRGRLESFAAALRAEHPAATLLTLVVDIADPPQCARAVAQVRGALGAVDILINNAAVGMGIVRANHLTNTVGIDEVTAEHWQSMIGVNLMGAWSLTKEIVGEMRERGWGRIITVTTSFFTMLRAEMHPYGPVKAALEAMCAGHAEEFAGSGVTVNVVVPGGPTDTAMVTKEDYPDRSQLIQPAAMARPGRWILSAEADTVTGMRYTAGLWEAGASVAEGRAASEAPIGWPALVDSSFFVAPKL
eukprot:SAG22_NODE_109_length_19706_cov_464.723772_12_plen_284_part_00